MNQSKQELRDTMRRKIAKIPHQEMLRHTAQLHEILLKQPWLDSATTICLYKSAQQEISLDPFIDTCFTLSKQVGLPRINSNSLEFREYRPNSSLEHHPIFDFLQPTNHETLINPNDIDLILVPLVAFDKKLNRLGRGGGHYDKFLASLPSTTQIIGVAHSIQQMPEVPTEPHDILMDIIVTEAGVLTSV